MPVPERCRVESRDDPSLPWRLDRARPERPGKTLGQFKDEVLKDEALMAWALRISRRLDLLFEER